MYHRQRRRRTKRPARPYNRRRRTYKPYRRNYQRLSIPRSVITRRRMPHYVMPDQLMVKMPYSRTFNYTAAATLQTVRMSLNAPNFPQIYPVPASPTTATSFDQYALFYREFEAVGMSWKVQFNNSNALKSTLMAVGPTSRPFTVSTSFNAFAEVTTTKMIHITSLDGSKSQNMVSGYASVKKTIGRTARDNSYTGNTNVSSSPPDLQAFLDIFLVQNEQSIEISGTLRVDVVYYVKLWGRKICPIGVPVTPQSKHGHLLDHDSDISMQQDQGSKSITLPPQTQSK